MAGGEVSHNKPVLSRLLEFEGDLGDVAADVDLPGQRHLLQLLRVHAQEVGHRADDPRVLLGEDCIVVVVVSGIVNLGQIKHNITSSHQTICFF